MVQLSPTILDHYENPRNVGELAGADAIGIVENSACGDVLQLYVNVEDGRIARAQFKTFGCAPAIAASSMLTEMITGATLQQLNELKKEAVSDALGGLPPMKMHCSVLAVDAVKAVLRNYADQTKTPNETT